jgi:hypothetical protein
VITINICIGDRLWFIRRTDGILKCYLDDRQLQRVVVFRSLSNDVIKLCSLFRQRTAIVL